MTPKSDSSDSKDVTTEILRVMIPPDLDEKRSHIQKKYENDSDISILSHFYPSGQVGKMPHLRREIPVDIRRAQGLFEVHSR